MKTSHLLLFFCSILLSFSCVTAQPLTGVWKGRIDRKNVELKIIKTGDSITGTSYYYTSASNYKRYSIKGYFDAADNSVVWWDDQLIEEETGKNLLPVKPASPYISRADFNCPGGTKMFLTGNAAIKKTEEEKGTVELQKFATPTFRDEWDFIIENYTLGANDPELIDSIGKIAFNKPVHSKQLSLVLFQSLLNKDKMLICYPEFATQDLLIAALK